MTVTDIIPADRRVTHARDTLTGYYKGTSDDVKAPELAARCAA
jgi:hypothetical protein